jgi:hypothetical protein
MAGVPAGRCAGEHDDPAVQLLPSNVGVNVSDNGYKDLTLGKLVNLAAMSASNGNGFPHSDVIEELDRREQALLRRIAKLEGAKECIECGAVEGVPSNEPCSRCSDHFQE